MSVLPADSGHGSFSHAPGDLLRRTALRYPDKLALVSGEVRWTYLEFNRAVNRCANSIAARGIEKGDRVAVLSHNTWEVCVLVFSLARIGAVLVPINFMLNSREIAFILRNSGASGFVVEMALHAIAIDAIGISGEEPRLRGLIGPDRSVVPSWESVSGWAGAGDCASPRVDVSDTDPLRIMYTSGTESRPKGVVLTSRNLVAQYVSCIIDGEMTHDEIEIHALPLYHCAQLDCFFCPDVYLGATSVILSKPEPDLMLRTIEKERATKLFCPPTVWISLLRSSTFDEVDLSSLRKGYYGASSMPIPILSELRERLPHVRLWNFYGQTEMAPVACILKPSHQLSHAGSAGKPALNVETKLVDDEGKDTPVGSVGEVVHRSPQTTVGYYGDDDATAHAYRNGWFHSGDLGVYSADGYLTIVDRKKDVIKTGGENVASREVEEAIYCLPGVAEVAVFGIPHPRWVEAVTAAIVPKKGVLLTSPQIMEHCRSILAPYKIPKTVLVVELLPKNPSGKILKRELRRLYEHLLTTA